MDKKDYLKAPAEGLFLVSRTSVWVDAKPCEEAFEVNVLRIDERTVDDPRKVPACLGKDDWWFSVGKNHCVVDGKIRRELEPEKRWAVQIDSIEKFVDKYGQCIVSRLINGFLEIEIYDDYRERNEHRRRSPSG